MAPEIFGIVNNKGTKYDKKCDIWSLGTILYELVYQKTFASDIKNIKELHNLLTSNKVIEIHKREGYSEFIFKILKKLLTKT